MPIYEFYCSDCHTIFQFLSRRAETERRPGCPRCQRAELDRAVSRFAVSRNRPEADDDPFSGMDEDKMERAMMDMAGEAEGLNEDDPRQMARFMRKFFDSTGMDLGGQMEEAIRRLERGEDPEKLEEEMGDLFGEDSDPFSAEGFLSGKAKRALRRNYLPPAKDDHLYDFPL